MSRLVHETPDRRIGIARPGVAALAIFVSLVCAGLRAPTAGADLGYEPVDWQGPDPANVFASLPFMPHGIVFDAARRLAYLSSPEEHRVVAFDLETAIVAWSVPLALEPAGLAISYDGSELLVALREGNPSDRFSRPRGWVGAIQLNAPSTPRRIYVPVDPLEIVTWHDGSFVVSTGSETGVALAWLSDTGDEPRVDVVRGRSPVDGGLALDPTRPFVYHSGRLDGFLIANRYQRRAGALVRVGMVDYEDEYARPFRFDADPTGRWLIRYGGQVLSLDEQLSEGFPRAVGYLPAERTGIIRVGFDVHRRLILGAFDGGVRYYNLDTLEPIAGPEGFGFVLAIGAVGLDIFVVQDFYGDPRLLRFDHPVPHGDTNRAPIARFEVSSTSGSELTTAHSIRLDATTSTDAESDLTYFWDLDEDGEYDDAFGSVVAWRFDTAGTFTVDLKVVDDAGAIAKVERDVQIAFRADPGWSGPEREPFALPSLVNDVVLDGANSRAYVASEGGTSDAFDRFTGRLDVYDLETGRVLRTYQTRPIRTLALSPDGAALYVGQHDPARRSSHGNQVGWVARLVTDALLIDEHYAIPVEPLDLVATDAGRLVMAPELGWGRSRRPVALLDFASRALVWGPSETVNLRSLALDPSQRHVYGTGGSVVRQPLRLDIGAEGSLAFAWGAEWDRDSRIAYRCWVSASGDLVFADSGFVYDATGMSPVDGLSIERVLWDRFAPRANDMAFDIARGVIAVGYDGTVVYRNSTTLEAFREIAIDGVVRHVGFVNEYVVVVVEREIEGATVLEIRRLAHPAPMGLAADAPRLKVAFPSRGARSNVGEVIELDLSDSKGFGSGLVFRWDLDGDGTWDSDFTAEPTFAHVFDVPGSKFVRVQTKDERGWVTEQELQFYVTAPAVALGATKRAPFFRLDYPVTDLEFDPWRPRLYAASQERERVFVVDGESGFVERIVSFDHAPRLLTLQPDSRRLYVVLAERIKADSRESAPAWLVSLSLDTFEEIARVRLAGNPIALVATEEAVVLADAEHFVGVQFYDPSSLERFGANEQISDPIAFGIDDTRGRILGFLGYARYMQVIDPVSGTVSTVDTWVLGSSSAIRGVDSGAGLLVRADGSVSEINGIDGIWLGERGRLESTRIDSLTIDPWRPAIITGSRTSIDFFNAESLLRVASVEVDNAPDQLKVEGRDVVWTAHEWTYTDVHRTPHLLLQAGEKEAPLAAIEVSSPESVVGDPVVFDASGSEAAYGRGLRFRWDLDDDGAWDADFDTQSVAAVTPDRAGTRFVRVQVVDDAGFVADAVAGVDVSPAVAEGSRDEVELPARASEIVFDPFRPIAYASNEDRDVVFAVDLESGYVRGRFDFNDEIRAMTYSEARDQLLVALGVAQPSRGWPAASQRGWLVGLTFDDGLAEDVRIAIAVDPYALVPLADDKLAITPETGDPLGPFAILDAISGRRIDDASRLLDPRRGFTVGGARRGGAGALSSMYRQHGNRVSRFTFSAAGSIDLDGTSDRLGRCRRQDLWTDESGSLLVDTGGAVYSIGDRPFGDDLDLVADWDSDCGSDTIMDVFFDDARGEIVVLQAGAVRTFDRSNLSERSRLPIDGLGRAIHPLGDRLVIFVDGPDGRTRSELVERVD